MRRTVAAARLLVDGMRQSPGWHELAAVLTTQQIRWGRSSSTRLLATEQPANTTPVIAEVATIAFAIGAWDEQEWWWRAPACL
jgi:hypothetical protein